MSQQTYDDIKDIFVFFAQIIAMMGIYIGIVLLTVIEWIIKPFVYLEEKCAEYWERDK